jgi:hypothetical protein
LLIYPVEDKLKANDGIKGAFDDLHRVSQSNNRKDTTMSTKMAMVMSCAVALSVAAAPLSSHAFARNSRLDLNEDAVSFQSARGGQLQMSLHNKGNAIHGEQPRQQDTRSSWIDDPVSPGG